MAYLVLNGDIIVQKGIFLIIGEHIYFVYYPIISYRKIKVYRVETMDMGRYHWNNGVSGTILMEQWCQRNAIVVSTMVLIVRDKILW